MWATCLHSASSGDHAEFNEGCYPKYTNPLNCGTSISDISGYRADFHEGHGTVRAWQGRGMTWRGRGTEWARHGMCELSLSVTFGDLHLESEVIEYAVI
jgi:hypothetical protein